MSEITKEPKLGFGSKPFTDDLTTADPTNQLFSLILPINHYTQTVRTRFFSIPLPTDALDFFQIPEDTDIHVLLMVFAFAED